MKEVYESDVRSALKDKFGFTNPMMIPRNNPANANAPAAYDCETVWNISL